MNYCLRFSKGLHTEEEFKICSKEQSLKNLIKKYYEYSRKEKKNYKLNSKELVRYVKMNAPFYIYDGTKMARVLCTQDISNCIQIIGTRGDESPIQFHFEEIAFEHDFSTESKRANEFEESEVVLHESSYFIYTFINNIKFYLAATISNEKPFSLNR
jgi:hypothetical protein